MKGVETTAARALTRAELEQEVSRAKTFLPRLEHLIIATTAPSDAAIQTFARKISEDHAAVGLFKVDVLAWPEIRARLTRHEDLLKRFYGFVGARKRVPRMAPKPPTDFVPRPAELETLRRNLLDVKGAPITTALRGAGGFGKTTLASVLANDPHIEQAYSDGTLWVELGEEPKNILAVLTDLVTLLTGARPGTATVQAAAAALARLRPELISLAARLGGWALLLKLVNGFLRYRVVGARMPLAQAVSRANEQLDRKGLVAFDARVTADRTAAVARTLQASLELLDTDQRARFGQLGVFAEDTDIPISIVAHFWRDDPDEILTENLLVELHKLSLLQDLDLDHRAIRLHDVVRRFLLGQISHAGCVALHVSLLSTLECLMGKQKRGSISRYFYLHVPYHLSEAGLHSRLDDLLVDPNWLKAKLEGTGNPYALIGDYEQYASGRAQRAIGRALRLVAGICVRDERQLLPQLVCRLMAHEDVAVKRFLDQARQTLPHPAIVTQQATLTPPDAEIARLEGHTAAVTALCILPNGQLASGSRDNVIRLWNMKTRTEINCLKGHGGTVTALCTSLDGLLVSGSSDGAIRVWNLETRAQRTFSSGSTHFSGSIAALCTLPDGRIAAAVSYPPFHEDPSIGAFNQIELWDVNEGVETTIFGGGEVTALCVLPDGRLVTSSSDVVGVWRMEGKGGHISLRLAAHARNKKIPLCALPDGRLASTTKDNAISLWDIEAGIETARLEGHSEPITALCMLPDGRLASGSQDNTIRMWDTTSAIQTELIDGLSNYVNNLCSLPNGELLSGSEDGTIRVWDISTSVKTTHRVKRSGPITVLSALTKQRVALVSDDNVIRLCGAETGAEFTRLKGHLAEVKALCLLPDGTLASGGWRSIRLWNVEVGIEIACLGEDSATALCALPHGLLASGDFSKIHIWDMRQHSEAFCLIRSDPKEDPYSLGPSCWISALCALPDGRLASEGRDHTIWLWDLDTKEVSGRLNGHFDNINVLFMLPDGRLASSSRDRTIRLWDLEAKRESVCLKGHRDSVDALCMLPDGRLASASHDRTIRLWAIDTAAEAACLEVDGPVNCLIALPNGCLVAGDKFGYLHWLNVVD